MQNKTSYLQEVNVLNLGGMKMSVFRDGRSINIDKKKMKNKKFYKKVNGELEPIVLPHIK